jgi:hypothetical protein
MTLQQAMIKNQVNKKNFIVNGYPLLPGFKTEPFPQFKIFFLTCPFFSFESSVIGLRIFSKTTGNSPLNMPGPFFSCQ